MSDYSVADEVADKIFTLIAKDDRLSPEITPEEILTIANQLIISVLRVIDDPERRECVCNLLIEKIRDFPALWGDNTKRVLH